MRPGVQNVVLSQLRNGLGACQGRPNAIGLARLASECGASTSGRSANSLDRNNQFTREYSSTAGALMRQSSPIAWSFSASATALLHRQDPAELQLVRSAATSATAPTKAAGTAPPPTADASSREGFPVGLAQLYPDPDAIPDHVLRRLRTQLFGKAIRPGEQTGRRALARPLQGRVLADWYFMPPSELPGFHNEEREYELSKALNRRHRKKDAEGEEAAGGKGGKKK
ncbi:hypothetical protein PLESTB_000332800 [Pleodorina starrii]|uniref:Uncharacterized protein n=1 Tax=Pleodorina starrii TaxID=330485 RepID=A0A9W6EZD6_9CHLO|nr:hypothetical protein PLESTM_001881900 [Pleodorina starrii]GLC50011.1 hypothetical protein PLESTB_000332800 [Pleodorina starrii]GLC75146.1 hypothetical protein PLESTF_001598900 [Pleodorina starrii]